MKHKTTGLTVALFAALIGIAFLFTACWQGTPAEGSGGPGGGSVVPGGGNTSTSGIEGMWKTSSGTGSDITLELKKGNKAKVTITAPVVGPVSSSGTYTITDNTIVFTGFSGAIGTQFNKEFGYKVEGNTLTLSDKITGFDIYQFKRL